MFETLKAGHYSGKGFKERDKGNTLAAIKALEKAYALSLSSKSMLRDALIGQIGEELATLLLQTKQHERAKIVANESLAAYQRIASASKEKVTPEEQEAIIRISSLIDSIPTDKTTS